MRPPVTGVELVALLSSSEAEYAGLWRSCHGLRRPSGLEGLGAIRRVACMFDGWNDRAYLIETDEEYAAVRWRTSA